jgi:hypothetical protein
MSTFITDFVARAAQTEAYSDETILIDYRSLQAGSNAEGVFAAYLAAACGAAVHRPHLFDSFFLPVIETAIWMGVETMDAFWESTESALEQNQNSEPQCQHFGPEALQFCQNDLRQHEPALARLLQARLHPTA